MRKERKGEGGVLKIMYTCRNRDQITQTHKVLFRFWSYFLPHTLTLLMPAALFMASISWKTPVVTAEVVARPSSYYEQEEGGREKG